MAKSCVNTLVNHAKARFRATAKNLSGRDNGSAVNHTGNESRSLNGEQLPRTVNGQFSRAYKGKISQAKGQFFLIGKDGGLKDYGQKLHMTAIFSTIDQMPMRKQEQLRTTRP